MKYSIIAVLLFLPVTAQANKNNDVIRWCIQSTNDDNKASACYQSWKQDQIAEEHAELRDFLTHNPRYTFPGQSLNRCWGKPREMPFESSWITVGPDGMSAGVNYKDTIPAGCYENAPWDNRDEN